MAMYQQKLPDDPASEVILTGQAKERSVQELPQPVTALLECSMPKNLKPRSPTYPTFHLPEYQDTCNNATLHDMAWLWGRTAIRYNMTRHSLENEG